MQKLMKAMHKSEKGFTLVELMVVVVIIAVLVAIAIPIYQGIQRTAAESAHDANVRTLKGAASVWFAEHGPAAVGGLTDGTLASGGGTFHADGVEGVENSDFGNYIDGGMPQVPAMLQDIMGHTNYLVTISSDGQITVVPDIGAYDS